MYNKKIKPMARTYRIKVSNEKIANKKRIDYSKERKREKTQLRESVKELCWFRESVKELCW